MDWQPSDGKTCVVSAFARWEGLVLKDSRSVDLLLVLGPADQG